MGDHEGDEPDVGGGVNYCGRGHDWVAREAAKVSFVSLSKFSGR